MKDNFSFIVIPDTQNLCSEHPEKLQNMTNWIADNAEKLNVKVIIHVGDLVNNGKQNEVEWKNHEQAFKVIEKTKIPTLFSIGNHDYDNLLQYDRNSSRFNQYCDVFNINEKVINKNIGVFEKSKNENKYFKTKINDINFLFLILEFGPRDEVINWANKVLEEHSNFRVIIITHSYMYINGKRTNEDSKHNPKKASSYFGSRFGNDGEDLWNKLVKLHKNVTSVYSGHHVGGNVSYRFDQGKNDTLVFQSFQNWQDELDGGNGRIRIIEYSLKTNTIETNVFNTDANLYETKRGYSISFPFDHT